MTKEDSQLFQAHSHEIEKEFATCPKCGGATNIRHSKSGPFIGCSNYPACDFTKAIGDNQVHTIKLLDEPICPLCGGQLAVKNGRFGMFIGCTQFPDCRYVADMAEQEDTGVPCPSCNEGELFQRSNRYGKTFYACDAYPKCKYAVNFKPVYQSCPECNWQILIEKNTAKGLTYQCPQKSCRYKSPPIESDG